ncbi:MAG: four helix bundle protein [Bacteroidetes bacterium]|nr:four helix bundle protein [Bacteroidota bacterium]
MSNRYLEIQDIRAYMLAFKLSNWVWKKVLIWDNFSKFTIGKQMVNAADSISANIAEGFGRYSKKDKIRFYRYARGSTKELEDWCNKAKVRNLFTQDEIELIYKTISQLPKEINWLIKITNDKLNK